MFSCIIKLFALKAVKNNALVLEFTLEKFKNDKEIVLEAVKNNGLALQFASKEIILKVVKING